MLPPEKEGDGKYAHLILNRNGDVLGVKPGFNEDGTRIDDTSRTQALVTGAGAPSGDQEAGASQG